MSLSIDDMMRAYLLAVLGLPASTSISEDDLYSQFAALGPPLTETAANALYAPIGGGSSVTIDATASDIQALGTLAAGSVGKAADAGHVHPLTGVQASGASAGGDLTGTYPSPTVAAGAITLVKQANLAADSIMGNNTGSAATPIALTVAQVKTLLAISAASDLTGALAAGNFPALTGDVTTAAGALATTIAAGAVTLAKHANLAADSIMGNNTASPAAPIALTTAQVMALLSGGATAAFAMNSQKITGLTNGSASSDAAAFGQIPVLDSTASDIVIPGTNAAGSTGKAADAGHIHSREFYGGFLPGDVSLKAWTFDPVICNGGYLLGTGGTVYGTKIWIPTCNVTNIILQVTTAGGTLTSGECFAGLYADSNNTLVGATSDQHTNWQSVGNYSMALASGPFAVTAGWFYVVVFANGTTLPTFARSQNYSSGLLNNAFASPHMRAFSADASRTTSFPNTMGTQTATAIALWAGVS